MGVDLHDVEGWPGAAGDQPHAAVEATAALRLTGVKPDEAGVVEIDDYVRYAFRAPAGTAGVGTVALRDPDGSSLVELGLDLATGRLVDATLVLFDRRAGSSLPSSGDAFATGLPTFSTDLFPADGKGLPRVDLPAPIHVRRGGDAAVVQIAPGEPNRTIRCGRALFLFAEDRLWGFGATELTERELALMTD